VVLVKIYHVRTAHTKIKLWIMNKFSLTQTQPDSEKYANLKH